MDFIYRSGIYELLKIFYENKKEELHFNKIVCVTNLARSSVDRHLKTLVLNEILNVKKEANLTKYSLNHINPLTISMLINFDSEKLLSLPINVRKILTEIRRNFDNNFIFVFGSYAKNNFKKNSDLDIFISVKDSSLIKENGVIRKLQLQYGVKIDLHISTFENSDSQRHIIETGFPIANYENFYEVYFGK